MSIPQIRAMTGLAAGLCLATLAMASGAAAACLDIEPGALLPSDVDCEGWSRDGEATICGTLEELMAVIDGGAILYSEHGFASAVIQNFAGTIDGGSVASTFSIFNQTDAPNAEALYDDPRSGTGEPLPEWPGTGEARFAVSLNSTTVQFHEECIFGSIMVVSTDTEALAGARCLAMRTCSLIRDAVPAERTTWGGIRARYAR
jgi:hypothetical protein